MIQAIQDLLGDISGWRPRCLKAEEELAQERWAKLEYARQLEEAKEKIRQLELLTPREALPQIDYIIQTDTAYIQACLALLNPTITRLALDGIYRLTNQRNFLNVIAWDWTDRLPYIRERFDCENFAILFKAYTDLYFELNQVGIVIDYESGHGYNLVVFPDHKVMVLEPQSDALYVGTRRPEAFYSLNGAFVLL